MMKSYLKSYGIDSIEYLKISSARSEMEELTDEEVKKEIEKIDKSEVPYFKLPYLEEEKILEIEHEDMANEKDDSVLDVREKLNEKILQVLSAS